MGVVVRQSIKNTLFTYIGILIGTFNMLWLYPRFLAPDEIGLIKLLQDIPLFFALFVQLGTSGVIDRYFSYFKDDQKGNNGFFFLILVYPLIGYSLFTASFFLFNDFWQSLYAEKSGLIIPYLIYLVPLTLLMMYISIMEVYLRANLLLVIPNVLREVGIRVLLSLIVAVYAFKLVDLNTLIFLFSCIYLISLVVLFYYISRKKLFLVKPNISFIKNSPLRKEILNYLFFMIPGTAGGLIALKIDNMMLGTMAGLTNVAVYSLAFYIGTITEIPRRSLSQVSVPLLAKAFKEENYTELNDLYKKNSLLQFLAGIIIFTMIWWSVDHLFYFIPNAEIYKDGKYVILFIGLAKLFDMITSVNGEIIQFSKYFKYNILFMVILAILSVLTNLWLIPIWGITGSAVATALTILSFNAIKTIFIYFKLNLHPFGNKMLPIVLLFILFMGITTFIPIQIPNTFLWNAGAILVKSSFVMIVFYGLIRYFEISPELNRLIDEVWIKLKIRKK